MTEAERAFVAGFFEGDGSITVDPKKLQVVFVNTSLSLLRWIQTRWGGAIYKQATHPNRLAGWKRQVYELRIGTLREQTVILRDMEPFLVSKTELVQNALVFADLQRRWPNKRPASVGKQLAALARRHKELRGMVPETIEPKAGDAEQLEVFTAHMAD